MSFLLSLYSEEVESLLCPFDGGRGVGRPGEVLGDEDSQEFEGLCPLYPDPIYAERGRTMLHFLLKSMMISLVLVVFSERLFIERYAARHFISSLYALLSPPEMSPTTVVSSANLMKMKI